MDEFKEPESVEGLFYYTSRIIGNGNVLCWVENLKCPNCGTIMGKPRKNGKPDRRAKEYICPNCGYKEPKKEYESKLEAKIIYKCPECGFEGKIKVPFKRKRIHGVESLRFFCENCKAPIDITKKFKDKKSRKE